MSNISFDELQRAYMSYRRITKTPRNQNTARQFYAFLGLDEADDVANRAYADGTQVSDEMYQKIHWLLGPNAEALYKAWEVKHVKGRK